MNTLGARIKFVRGKESQDAFATKMGVSKGSLGGYERDENSPSAEAVLKICSGADISVEWLMTGQGPMRRGQSPQEPSTAQVSPETAGMLTGMHGKLGRIEQGIAENRAVMSQNHVQYSSQSLELYAKLTEAHERLYQAAERERELFKEISALKEELVELRAMKKREEEKKDIMAIIEQYAPLLKAAADITHDDPPLHAQTAQPDLHIQNELHR